MSTINPGAILVPAVLTGFFVAVRVVRSNKKFGAKGTGLFNFHLKKNIFLIMVFVNLLFCAGGATDVAAHLHSNIKVRTPTLGGEDSWTILHHTSIWLVMDAFFTTILVAWGIETVCPWDDGWEEEAHRRKIARLVVQIWGFGNGILGSLARIVIWKAAHALGAGDYEADLNADASWSSSVGSDVTIMNNSLQVLAGAEFFNMVYLVWWASWVTWWNRERVEEYVCPVCHGSCILQGAEGCTECYDGVVYHHP